MLARLLEWFISSPPATIITAVGAIIAAFRVQSNYEHRKTLGAIKGVSDQVNGNGSGDLHARLDRIEKTLGIRISDEAK